MHAAYKVTWDLPEASKYPSSTLPVSLRYADKPYSSELNEERPGNGLGYGVTFTQAYIYVFTTRFVNRRSGEGRISHPFCSPSAPLLASFCDAGKLHTYRSGSTGVLITSLVTLPFPASKVKQLCGSLPSLVARSRRRPSRTKKQAESQFCWPWLPNGRDGINPLRSASVLLRPVWACSRGALDRHVLEKPQDLLSSSQPALTSSCPSWRSGPTVASNRDGPPRTSARTDEELRRSILLKSVMTFHNPLGERSVMQMSVGTTL